MTAINNIRLIFVILFNFNNPKFIGSSSEKLTSREEEMLNNTAILAKVQLDSTRKQYQFNNLSAISNTTNVDHRYDNRTGQQSDHQKEYLSSSRYYINYKKTYGIRYDPTKIRRSFKYSSGFNSYKDLDDDIDYHSINSQQNLSFNSNEYVTEIKPISYLETTTASNFNLDDEIVDVEIESNNVIENLSDDINYLNTTTFLTTIDETSTREPLPSSTVTNIMNPSRVQMAIDYVKNRLQQLFQFRRYDLSHSNEKRFLNVFSLIKFQNYPCSTSNSLMTQLNGTCYHGIECNQLGGVAVGKCADGFGVCCICKYLFKLYLYFL